MNDLKIFLQNISPLSDESWQKVQAVFCESRLEKGGIFLKEGQVARNIGFLRRGVIRAFYRSAEGMEYNKSFFVDNSFFGGYSSLITGNPNQIIHQALTECSVFIADYEAFTALYDQHPDLERIARKLAELFFVYKEKKEVEIVLLDAEQRYAIFRKEFPGLEQQIPQYHIASYLGITPTQLSRIRKKMATR